MSSSFSLQVAVPADASSLADICGASFETDRHTQLKAAHPTKPYNHAEGMKGALEHWLSLPKTKIEITKAVDDSTGEILGLVAWGFRLQQPQSAPKEEPRKEDKEQSTPDEGQTDEPTDALEQLNAFTSKHMVDFMERIMPKGTRAIYIATIAVHPKHQGRGVGTALINKGTAIADAEGVIAWVHSSEAGADMFRKCGFELDDTLEIDLDTTAAQMDIKPPGGDEKWGTYKFRYLVRQPKAA